MTYLLIAVIMGFNSGGAAPVVAEFNTKEACMAAAAQVRRQSTKDNEIRSGGVLFCTPKG